jgi:hypothetical protein
VEGKAEREVVAAHAAIVLGERQSEETQFPHASDDFVGELAALVESADDRGNNLAREIHHCATERLMLIVESEADHAAMLPGGNRTSARL